jgi:hypothetical protein
VRLAPRALPVPRPKLRSRLTTAAAAFTAAAAAFTAAAAAFTACRVVAVRVRLHGLGDGEGSRERAHAVLHHCVGMREMLGEMTGEKLVVHGLVCL